MKLRGGLGGKLSVPGRAMLLLLAVALLLFPLACRTSQRSSDREESLGSTPAPEKPKECPNLEYKLYRLIKASDPAEFAKQEDIYYHDGFVRVIIELSSEEKSVPAGYRVQVEGREGELVQALVSVDDLCALSNEPEVVNIRLPVKPIPLG